MPASSSMFLLIIVPLLVFGALCASSFALVYTLEQTAQDESRKDALILAQDTGRWFSDQLDQAITPLFSLAQFVHELQVFQELPHQIGSPFQHHQHARPMASAVHRNITGICDDTKTVQRFAKIAASIKENAHMQGVLVNLQLAPQAVVCLVHPVVNTEDFPPGSSLNNTRSIGHDLLVDPQRRFIAEETLTSSEGAIGIAGPYQLLQCSTSSSTDGGGEGKSDCDALAEKAFIIRLPIIMKGYNISGTDGTVYEDRWGFAVAIINWQVLVQRSQIFDEFQQRGWNFQLTRTDQVLNKTTDVFEEEVSGWVDVTETIRSSVPLVFTHAVL